MPTPRERFRQAAADFAESFYDLLRADLLPTAVAPAVTSAPAPATASSASPTSAPAAVARVDTLAAWLREHGAATPTELRTGLGWGNSSLFEVIKQALTRDLIAKRVEGRLVQYFVAGAEPSTTAAAPAGPTPETRQRVFDHLMHHGASTLAELVNGVGIDDAIVRAVLSEASSAGQVRATGRGRAERFMLVIAGLDDEVASAERIKHGRVGAVVILEGLTGTTQIKAIVEACKAAGLPFAYGGRAGTESLRSALTELETRAAGAA